MGYTDLWRCKKCGSMPEIIMQGKNFLVRCSQCNDEKVNVYANNIDQVVREWNKRNDPSRIGLWASIRKLFKRSE
jgi:uncharacterized protein with PIN domain